MEPPTVPEKIPNVPELLTHATKEAMQGRCDTDAASQSLAPNSPAEELLSDLHPGGATLSTGETLFEDLLMARVCLTGSFFFFFVFAGGVGGRAGIDVFFLVFLGVFQE